MRHYVFLSGLKWNFQASIHLSPTVSILDITKTCLYNFDPLKPHFYIVKLGFTGIYSIFLISAQKHRLWYSLEPPHRSLFWAEIGKISEFFIWKFSVFGDEIFYIFVWACFRNEIIWSWARLQYDTDIIQFLSRCPLYVNAASSICRCNILAGQMLS